ncbi:MAG: MotA/TolQ/ExbB proton channel family protein [Victivallales bacterium]|nr:MotA/TolQ/ExbB proton channel family protein [Victivallales bacterium]
MRGILRLSAILAVGFSVAFVVLALPESAMAQGVEAVDGGGEAPSQTRSDTSFFQIIANSGVIGILIWIMIFATSAATLGLIIDAFLTIKSVKIMPPELVNQVRSALDQGDLGGALDACSATPGPLANILSAGFNNVSEGYDVVMDSVSTAADIESEKLMQRVNFLNLCGAIAPMLGLMGTVTGMVDAFAGLASAQGAEKATMLALAISQALYTTAFGLLISVPAILAFTFVRNHASRLILDMESLTYDLIKVLRGAEVVDDQAGGEYYEQ